MPDPQDDPKSSEWRPYIFARDQSHCRICGESFLCSETVRKHISNEHHETMPPSMCEYFPRRSLAAKEIPVILTQYMSIRATRCSDEIKLPNGHLL